MSNTLKIIIPDFGNPTGDEDSYEVRAQFDDNIIGHFSVFPFNRYDFIEETEYLHEDFCFFARRLELYQRPYLNPDGLIIMVIDKFVFDGSLSIDYQIAFLKNAVKRIAEKAYNTIADIYILTNEYNTPICEAAGFEIADRDSLYGVWMHYIP